MTLVGAAALTVCGLLVCFFLYRLWLETQSDAIIAETKLDADKKKREEYERQDAELSKEVQRAQAAFDADINSHDDGRGTSH